MKDSLNQAITKENENTVLIPKSSLRSVPIAIGIGGLLFQMKNLHLLILFFACLLASCNGSEPVAPYVYNSNPSYTWGYAEFYGAYYSQYEIKNNTISLSLFSDSLKLVSQGIGQYLFLEDVFVSPTDTLLPIGKYTISKTEATDIMTFYSGKLDTIDSEVYPIGAYISYYEENSAKSTLKLISDGTFTVSHVNDTIYNIVCDFVTSDSLKLKGTFTGKLKYYDQSLQFHHTLSPIRRRKMIKWL